MYGRASFSTKDDEKILLKVGISPVSIEGARLALKSEQPGWNFEATRRAAQKAWNDELERICIEGDEEQKRIFYTAMYHAMMAPVLFSDIDGSYRGADGNIYKSDTVRYTNYSLWDTYRAKQPLMTIIQPERAGQFVASMIDICDHQGDLPVWHLWGNETNCMVGDPGIPVVADAIVKDIKGFDRERAFEAIKKGFTKLFEWINDRMKIEVKGETINIGRVGYATGGFPEDGLFMANHNELVGKFSNGKTVVANNQQIVDGIQAGVYNAVMNAMANSNGSASYISNEIVVDGDVIARTITKAQEKQQRRYSPQTV
jgi:putative alpha-1,2-mannosidase